MRWLTARLGNERGASAVLVAVLLVPLFGFAAIAVDVGALYVERGQLQNGADAAALAIAQDCATDGVCTGSAATAAVFADANALDGAANVLTPTFPTSNSVTVTSSTRVAGTDADAISHPFARFIGIDSTTVRAEATAEWGGPGSGTVLALALSWCEFQESLGAPGGRMTIRTDTNKECKHLPSTEVIPGGFGWIDNTTGPCEATINLSLNLDAAGELWVDSDPGASVPSECKPSLSKFKNEPVLIPIYDLVRGTGTNAEYRIFAFAAFTVTGWKFPSTPATDIDLSAPICPPSPASCPGGNWKGIQGIFEELVSVDSAFGLGGPQLNGTIVRLSN
ncbi:MAG TPA: pilus assembly protein TadG-related protein [Cryobacterium sp.]|nr:pilus assembly protein TadG-related protein [Cryobacterium sp.]